MLFIPYEYNARRTEVGKEEEEEEETGKGKMRTENGGSTTTQQHQRQTNNVFSFDNFEVEQERVLSNLLQSFYERLDGPEGRREAQRVKPLLLPNKSAPDQHQQSDGSGNNGEVRGINENNNNVAVVADDDAAVDAFVFNPYRPPKGAKYKPILERVSIKEWCVMREAVGVYDDDDGDDKKENGEETNREQSSSRSPHLPFIHYETLAEHTACQRQHKQMLKANDHTGRDDDALDNDDEDFIVDDAMIDALCAELSRDEDEEDGVSEGKGEDVSGETKEKTIGMAANGGAKEAEGSGNDKSISTLPPPFPPSPSKFNPIAMLLSQNHHQLCGQEHLNTPRGGGGGDVSEGSNAGFQTKPTLLPLSQKLSASSSSQQQPTATAVAPPPSPVDVGIAVSTMKAKCETLFSSHLKRYRQAAEKALLLGGGGGGLAAGGGLIQRRGGGEGEDGATKGGGNKKSSRDGRGHQGFVNKSSRRVPQPPPLPPPPPLTSTSFPLPSLPLPLPSTLSAPLPPLSSISAAGRPNVILTNKKTAGTAATASSDHPPPMSQHEGGGEGNGGVGGGGGGSSVRFNLNDVHAQASAVLNRALRRYADSTRQSRKEKPTSLFGVDFDKRNSKDNSSSSGKDQNTKNEKSTATGTLTMMGGNGCVRSLQAMLAIRNTTNTTTSNANTNTDTTTVTNTTAIGAALPPLTARRPMAAQPPPHHHHLPPAPPATAPSFPSSLSTKISSSDAPKRDGSKGRSKYGRDSGEIPTNGGDNANTKEGIAIISSAPTTTLLSPLTSRPPTESIPSLPAINHSRDGKRGGGGGEGVPSATRTKRKHHSATNNKNSAKHSPHKGRGGGGGGGEGVASIVPTGLYTTDIFSSSASSHPPSLLL